MERIWLEEIRRSHQMTQEDVASRAGIKRNYYSMIASGDRKPSVRIAKRIADVLDFDWTFFFDDQSHVS